VSKAEGDYDVVTLLLRSRKRSRFDPICFHCQQCVEKYLKARLTEASLPFPKVHDLATLLGLVAAIEPSWSRLKPELNTLTQHGVLTRYPGADANAAEARTSVATCRAVRRVVRRSLGLKA
jgi:HEPN domain-containing protein